MQTLSIQGARMLPGRRGLQRCSTQQPAAAPLLPPLPCCTPTYLLTRLAPPAHTLFRWKHGGRERRLSCDGTREWRRC